MNVCNRVTAAGHMSLNIQINILISSALFCSSVVCVFERERERERDVCDV